MIRAIDNYYLQQEEPARSCLQALRDIILGYDENITEAWKYRMPFFCYHKKMLCYLWTDKKTKQPYIGIVEGRRLDHPLLEQGNRSRMKILKVDAAKDIPMALIDEVFEKMLALYR